MQKVDILHESYLRYWTCGKQSRYNRFQIRIKNHFEAGTLLKNKNTQSQVDFSGSEIKKESNAEDMVHLSIVCYILAHWKNNTQKL